MQHFKQRIYTVLNNPTDIVLYYNVFPSRISMLIYFVFTFAQLLKMVTAILIVFARSIK